MDISAALEAILFAAGESVPLARLSLVLDTDETELGQIAAELSERYEREQRGIRILRLGDKLQMCSAPDYAPYVIKTLEQRKPPMLSQSALETLAIVAYFQPVTRAYIDRVRGVDRSGGSSRSADAWRRRAVPPSSAPPTFSCVPWAYRSFLSCRRCRTSPGARAWKSFRRPLTNCKMPPSPIKSALMRSRTRRRSDGIWLAGSSLACSLRSFC